MQEPQDLSPQHNHQESESTPNPSTSATDRKPLYSPVPPSNVIGVFGLSNRTNERGLEEVFGAFGQIQRINLIKDRATGESRGFGFIYYETVSEAESAKEKTNAMNLDGREIRVDFSKTSGPHSSTPGQYLGKHRLDRGRYSSDRRYSSSGKRSYSPEDSDRGSRHHRYRSRSPSSSSRRDYHRHEAGRSPRRRNYSPSPASSSASRRDYSPRSGNASSSRRAYSPERSFSRRSRSPASPVSSSSSRSSSRRIRSPIRNYSPNRPSRRNQSSPIHHRRHSGEGEPRNFDSPSSEASHPHHQ